MNAVLMAVLARIHGVSMGHPELMPSVEKRERLPRYRGLCTIVGMALLSIQDLRDGLICPACRSQIEDSPNWHCSNRDCLYHRRGFSSAGSVPVLIDFERSIFQPDAFESGKAPEWRSGGSKLKRTIAAIVSRLNGTNHVAERNGQRLRELMTSEGRKRLLVIGGATIGSGADGLYADKNIEIVAFDVVGSAWTQFIADAHAIPLADGTVDAVWIQAVLEHVLEPSTVVSEIFRVLSEGGLVYADTPFMQQVHLGAYDFTRFTESGQRWLFRNFERIDSGLVWGPGTQLAWSFDYAARSVARSNKIGRLARLVALPAAWIVDRLSSPAFAIDGASAVYFLGRKSHKQIRANEMTQAYQGAQRQSRMS